MGLPPKYRIVIHLYYYDGYSTGMREPKKREDGTFASFRQPPTSDIINIKYYDFTQASEKDEYVVIHEMTIDLENLTVVE